MVSNSVGRYLTIAGVDIDSCIIDLSVYPSSTSVCAFTIKDHFKIRNLTFKTRSGTTEHIGIFLTNINGSPLQECDIKGIKFRGGFDVAILSFSLTGIVQDCFFTKVPRNSSE
ncbi:MAG: hypothetical protein IPJ75_02130 [Ignavibacteriales bacterium]|nr:hypothetical protein [Ignavibacteriales bacterium]